MKRFYVLLTFLVFAFGVQAQNTMNSVALAGSCTNPDSGTIDFIFDMNLNCPEADPTGVLPGRAMMGFHSGANNWATIVAWDDSGAVQLMNNGNDSFLVSINVMDYYGIPFGDLLNIELVINDGPANPGDPWTISFRDSVNGMSFGNPTDCSDMIIVMDQTPTCADLAQSSSLLAFSDATDANTCMDTTTGMLHLELDYALACPEGDTGMVLAGVDSLGLHSGANGWSAVVAWDDPNAVQLVNDGNDNFTAMIDPVAYYGVPMDSLVDIQMVANNGIANPGAAWDAAIRDPRDSESFGNVNPCSDLLIVIAELPVCTDAVSIQDLALQRSFKMVPNPFDERAFLEFDNPDHEQFEVSIRNMSGQLIRTIPNVTGNRVVIERGTLSAGMYLATLRDQEGRFATAKFVVK